jgi:alpha-beta hydrolase superfamily lysophospholipase
MRPIGLMEPFFNMTKSSSNTSHGPLRPKRRKLRGWKRVLVHGVVIYAGICLFMFFLANRLVYLPMAHVEYTPAAHGIDYESFFLTTEDQEKLHVWEVPATEAPDKGWMLICHGNAGNLGHRVSLIRDLHETGYSILIFDYRGYGESTGKPTEEGTYQDLHRVWTYLIVERGVLPENVVLFGRSLGGAVVAELATSVFCRAVVLESTFTSLAAIASDVYPFLPCRLLLGDAYNTLERIKTFKAPVLILASPDDQLIDISHSKQLFEIAPEPKEFVYLQGGHNETSHVTEAYPQKIDDGIDAVTTEADAE